MLAMLATSLGPSVWHTEGPISVWVWGSGLSPHRSVAHAAVAVHEGCGVECDPELVNVHALDAVYLTQNKKGGGNGRARKQRQEHMELVAMFLEQNSSVLLFKCWTSFTYMPWMRYTWGAREGKKGGQGSRGRGTWDWDSDWA